MRRANGTGSVYKMKHKPLRKPYRAIITLDYTDDGKPIRKTIGTFKTSKEALLALSTYCITPDIATAEDITVKQVWDLMLEDRKRRGIILSSSYAMAERKLKLYMNTPIKDIRLAHLQRIFDEDMEGLKSSTVGQIKAKLNILFKIAMKNDYVDKNYASMIVVNKQGFEEKLHRPYLSSEIETLWKHSYDKNVQIILIYMYTGMRSSELLNVNIKDVHLKEQYMIGGSKTKSGKNRTIPIADCILPFVNRLYNENKFGKTGKLLPKGKMWPRYMTNSTLNKYKIQHHTPHDTRHTFITMLTNYGVNDKTIKSIVGHSQTGDVTKDVYTHLTKQQLLIAVNKLPHTSNIKMFPSNLKVVQ